MHEKPMSDVVLALYQDAMPHCCTPCLWIGNDRCQLYGVPCYNHVTPQQDCHMFKISQCCFGTNLQASGTDARVAMPFI